ncbi:MAG: hypothetical protein CVU87_07460 [Firmicutes bacterium HGW-Firmicutes-12]|jgi:hypothetical protein|nr:MAG: hypothetical protein CVU87_07460 [Firmicutes bacterium HGW-Firmicutes-12]
MDYSYEGFIRRQIEEKFGYKVAQIFFQEKTKTMYKRIPKTSFYPPPSKKVTFKTLDYALLKNGKIVKAIGTDNYIIAFCSIEEKKSADDNAMILAVILIVIIILILLLGN